MRILFLSPIGDIGGAERVLLDLIAGLRATSTELDLHLLLLADGPLAESARQLGVSVTLLPAPESISTLGDSAADSGKVALLARTVLAAPGTWRLARKLRDAIDRIAPDIVHSIGLKTHLLLGVAKPKGPRKLWHIHDFVSARPIVAGLLRRVSRDVTAVAISRAVGQDINHWLPNNEARVVLNGIDTDRFAPDPPSALKFDKIRGTGALIESNRNRNNVDIGAIIDNVRGPGALLASGVRVGLVATFARWKGQDIFIRAAAKLTRDAAYDDLRFFIVGGPIYTTRGSQFSRDELQQLIDESGARDRIALVGPVHDLAAVYRALDIVVHASTKPEPFGLTIAEAMSCGRPVIVSAAGGAVELFTNEQDALGIAPGDAEAMSFAIARLAKDPQLGASLGTRARATAKFKFTRDRMAREMLSVYRSPGSGE